MTFISEYCKAAKESSSTAAAQVNLSDQNLDYYWFDNNDMVGDGEAGNLRVDFLGTKLDDTR